MADTDRTPDAQLVTDYRQALEDLNNFLDVLAARGFKVELKVIEVGHASGNDGFVLTSHIYKEV